MTAVITYMSEIAPKKVRGALVAGYQLCITIGILLTNCVVYATQNRGTVSPQFLRALFPTLLPGMPCELFTPN